MRRILAGLLTLLVAAPAPRPATAAWHEATSDHFQIYAEEEEGTVRAFAERLERFDAALRHLRGLSRDGSTANKLTIFALSNSRAVSALYGKGGSAVGGWYTPRDDGSIAVIPISTGPRHGAWQLTETAILLHEYAHHFFFRNSPAAYPAWYVEGFAEFFSTARAEPDGAVMVGLAAGHRAYELVGLQIPTAELLAATRLPAAERRGVLYAKGWLMTHYFTFNKERAPQFAAYLAAINKGVPAAKAAESFGDLKALDRELRGYMMRSRLQAFRVPADRIAIGPIRMRRLTPGRRR